MNCDIAIVGAGLVGASLAAGLHGAGLRTVLLEPETAAPDSPLTWDSRIYAVSPGSQGFFAACGAWERIEPTRIARVEAMHIFGDAAGAELRFSAYQAGLPQLCYIVESRAMQAALRDAIAERAEVMTHQGAQAVGFSIGEDSAVLELADGTIIESKLIVGADGSQSWVREYAGIRSTVRSYEQQGVVANFETEHAHRDIARQWFRRDGVLALLPLPGNRVSMVWSTWNDSADRLLGMDGSDFLGEVEAACGHALGSLRLLSPPLGFPLRMLRVSEWVRPRLALIGDAAHTVHPLAGQGGNLGFQDARELARVLRSRGAQDDCGDYRLLRRYARARREPVAAMQATTDGLQRLFDSPFFALRWLRNSGLRLTNGVVPLKRLLIAHALG